MTSRNLNDFKIAQIYIEYFVLIIGTLQHVISKLEDTNPGPKQPTKALKPPKSITKTSARSAFQPTSKPGGNNTGRKDLQPPKGPRKHASDPDNLQPTKCRGGIPESNALHPPIKSLPKKQSTKWDDGESVQIQITSNPLRTTGQLDSKAGKNGKESNAGKNGKEPIEKVKTKGKHTCSACCDNDL